MFICSSCGKICEKGKVYSGNRCQGCYNYFRNGGTVNPIPAPGTIAYDHRGYVVCHICGRAYVRLGSHVRESHHITIKEYKAEFGLCNRCKTTEHRYSKAMSDLAYENGMDKQIVEAGKSTRIRKGENDKRYGKKVRLQERIEKQKRYEKEEL